MDHLKIILCDSAVIHPQFVRSTLWLFQNFVSTWRVHRHALLRAGGTSLASLAQRSTPRRWSSASVSLRFGQSPLETSSPAHRRQAPFENAGFIGSEIRPWAMSDSAYFWNRRTQVRKARKNAKFAHSVDFQNNILSKITLLSFHYRRLHFPHRGMIFGKEHWTQWFQK